VSNLLFPLYIYLEEVDILSKALLIELRSSTKIAKEGGAVHRSGREEQAGARF